jgi:hypothetical protein
VQPAWITPRGRMFGTVLLWLGGASLAILISMQVTVWAHAKMKAWFVATLNHAFASAMAMGETHATVARGCKDTPDVLAREELGARHGAGNDSCEYVHGILVPMT